MDAISAGLLGGSLVAFITGGWNYLDKRKTAPETAEIQKEGILLNFWVGEVQKVKDSMTLELNGIRQSLENKHANEIKQIRQESETAKSSSDFIIASLQTEVRRMIENNSKDQIEFQKQLSIVKDDFHSKLLIAEKEKTDFLQKTLERFETFCREFRDAVKLEKLLQTNASAANLQGRSELIEEQNVAHHKEMELKQ